MITFIDVVGNDDDHTDSNVAVAAGLLGYVIPLYCGNELL